MTQMMTKIADDSKNSNRDKNLNRNKETM